MNCSVISRGAVRIGALGMFVATTGLVALPAAHAAAPAYHPTMTADVHTEAATLAGSTLRDSALIGNVYASSNGGNAGTVSFTLYGPFSTAPTAGSCTTASTLYTPTAINVTGNTSGTGSASYSSGPTNAGVPAGTYQWIASYTGDANNSAISGVCGDTTEQFVVSKTNPSLTTSPSAP